MMMHMLRKTSLEPMLARDLHAEMDPGQIPSTERTPRILNRRSLLAGLGVTSCTALTSSLALPGSARAHQGHHHDHGDHDGPGNNPKDVVWGLMGAFETLDVEEIASWLHDDIVFQNSGLPDLVGKDAVEQFMSPLALAFDSFTIDVVTIMSKGKVVCTERVERYVVAEDSPLGFPGAELCLKVAGWHEIKHGKVIRWSDYWDTRIFSNTLGIPLPTP
jgi:limonene-1,2-epoxide hydrolase